MDWVEFANYTITTLQICKVNFVHFSLLLSPCHTGYNIHRSDIEFKIHKPNANKRLDIHRKSALLIIHFVI